MDTRITPFGDHPDGGKIKEFSAGEEMPDYMMPLSSEAREILEKIPIPDRVNYVVHSTEPELWEAREFLKKRLRDKFKKDLQTAYNKIMGNDVAEVDRAFTIQDGKVPK